MRTCTLAGCNGKHKGHGLCAKHLMQERAKREPLYAKWSTMRKRCNSPGNARFPGWGARGIRVCERWNKFENYKRDIEALGPQPSPNHSIDRIDNDGDYEPSNVHWADHSEQSRNRRKPKTNKSGYKGVLFSKSHNKWEARIGIRGIRKHLGFFDTKEEAINARKKAEKEFN